MGVGMSAYFRKYPSNQLHIGTAHAARPDLNQNFIGLNVRNRHVLENESLSVFVHACRFHVCLFLRW
jgi:hypothetical protein